MSKILYTELKNDTYEVVFSVGYNTNPSSVRLPVEDGITDFGEGDLIELDSYPGGKVVTLSKPTDPYTANKVIYLTEGNEENTNESSVTYIYYTIYDFTPVTI